jgi:UDP-glucuronate 4-epimerase
MKILVTGGAGFIGSNLIRHILTNTDHTVICVDNFNDYYSPAIKESNIAPFIGKPRFALYRADIVDYKTLKEIFDVEKIDKVCHLAARAGVRPSIEDPFIYQKANIQGTLNLLDLSREYKIKNFVFASSSSVYGNQKKVPFSEKDPVNQPISPYAATKKSTEMLAHTYHHLYDIPITALRFFTVYGTSGRPDMAPYKFTKWINEGIPVTKFGDGTTKRDYTYIDDIVPGILSALVKNLPFEIINLGNNKPVQLNYFIKLIENLVGKKAIIRKLPMQPGDVDITYADITKAQRLLDYNPVTTIEEGMEKFVNWYLKNNDFPKNKNSSLAVDYPNNNRSFSSSLSHRESIIVDR